MRYHDVLIRKLTAGLLRLQDQIPKLTTTVEDQVRIMATVILWYIETKIALKAMPLDLNL